MVGAESANSSPPSDQPHVSELQAQPASKKRKRDGIIESKGAIKKKRSAKAKDDEVDSFDVENGINTAIGRFDSRLLADYVAQRTKRWAPDLSLVDLEDRQIPEKAYVDTSDWDSPRTLKNMAKYLQNYGSISKQPQLPSNECGSPHTLIITSAGLRAADITRVLRVFQSKDCIVAKLFAKHIKLKDAIDYVKKTRMGIGVGTPSRVTDLLEAGALSSRNLARIVVDFSHIDEKKRGILDMRETHQGLTQLLNRSELKQRYAREHDRLDLLFY